MSSARRKVSLSGLSLHSRFSCQPYLTSSDGGDDADFVGRLDRRFLVLQESDVLFVHVNVHETAHAAIFIQQAFLDARKFALQFSNGPTDRIGRYFNQLFVVGQLAQWCWY